MLLLNVVNVGVVANGNPSMVKKCDGISWEVQEVAGGIEVEFTFHVPGNGKAKKVKTKGKSQVVGGHDYIVQAFNGVTWDNIDTITLDTVSDIYVVNLDSSYTINGEVKIKIYRATGTNLKIFIDCIAVIVDKDAGIPEPEVDDYGYWDEAYVGFNYTPIFYWMM